MTGLRRAGSRQTSAQGHIVQVVASAQTVWTALPPAGYRHMDQPRVNVLQPGSRKAELVQSAGTEAFHQNIGVTHQPLEDRPVRLPS